MVQRHVYDEEVMRIHQSVPVTVKLKGTCKRHALDACSPRDFGGAFSASIFPGLCGGLLGQEPQLSYPQRTAAAPYHLPSNIPSQRKPCPGCPRQRQRGTSFMVFSSDSPSPSHLRLPSPRTGNVGGTVILRKLTYAPSSCGVMRYWMV